MFVVAAENNTMSQKKMQTRLHIDAYRDYRRIACRGGRIGHYTMLWDGEWWACEKDGHQLEFMGEFYRKSAEVENFVGNEGAVIMGYIKIEEISEFGLYRYEFFPIKNLLQFGYVLQNTAPVRNYHCRNPKYCR
jgi:hypothetical protein